MSLVVITSGEPAGIGPDLVILAAQQPRPAQLVLADSQMLLERAQQLKIPIRLIPYQAGNHPSQLAANELLVEHHACQQQVQSGQLDVSNAGYVLALLDRAIDGCLSGEFSAMMTCPVHKGIINQAGIAFSGHTEYLEAKTEADQVVMLLATEGLKVALATTHLPLRQVSDAITAPLLNRILRQLDQGLKQDFACSRPRILVAGLNPHAGEAGHLGREEIEVIEPCLAELRAQGLDLIGPLPADTLFTPKYLDQADAVLAMYHDQGLPVLKYKGFGAAANISLGLPIVRTSVDHGTALDLAGSGQIDLGSYQVAIQMAQDIVQHRNSHAASGA